LSEASQPERAARRYLEALGRVTSCVTAQRRFTPTRYLLPNRRYRIDFPGRPASLRASSGGRRGLLFDVETDAAIVEAQADHGRRRWRVSMVMYQYRLLDHDERELLVYHWQPGPDYLGPDEPHLHVSASLNAQTSAVDRQPIDLDKLHLATGRVSMASVVRMLITEFRVAPRRHDWAETLDRTERTFQEEAGQFA
jgi:hypothetical protein